MATAFFEMSRSARNRSFSRRSREIYAAGSTAGCGAEAGIGYRAAPHPALRCHCKLRGIEGEMPSSLAIPAQRPTAAHQQGYRFPLELTGKMTPSLAHSTPFRSRCSSTNSGESQHS
jgi:hypothetical protein